MLVTGHRASVALLLFRYPLLLFWWTLVAVLVTIFIVEEAFESLDQLRLLIFNVFLVGVARKVDVFTFSGLLD